MHVLIVPASYPRFYKSLSGTFYRDQAIALMKSGAAVGVIDPAPRSIRTFTLGGLASHRSQVTTTVDAGFPVVHANDWCLPYARKLYAKQFIRRAMDLFEHYSREFGRPDVIHGQGMLWGGVAARAIAVASGIPYVLTEHSGEYALFPILPWTLPLIRETMRDASSVLAVSSELARRLRPLGDGRPLRVVPNVVDTEFFHRPQPRAVVEPFLFVSVASQLMYKGMDVLLRAFAIAFAGNAQVRLEIGGDGADRPRFIALAEALDIASQVMWRGALTREQVRECLWRADAFVLPSRYETFGVVFIEAMATGLPVITTRCGGPEDFVDENCGCLVEVDQPDQLAEAMTTMRRDRELWRQRAASIRQCVVDRFREEVIARQLCEIYEEAAQARPVGMRTQP